MKVIASFKKKISEKKKCDASQSQFTEEIFWG